MEPIFTRLWHDLIARPDGPMAFRFYLQPAMATLFAIKDGRKDARHEDPPYLFSLFMHPERRRELIRDGWRSIAKIVILAFVLDVVYQLLVIKQFYPLESVIIAFVLAVIPYTCVRGLVNRLVRRRQTAAEHTRDRAA